MFSFRTTPLDEQLDKALVDGKVGCFCTQNSWNPETGQFLYGLFAGRGNLREIFSPQDTELCPDTNHILFSRERLEGLNAVVVEIQDIGTRYFNYTRDVFSLMETLKTMENAPSLYIVDHMNPAGRVVQGTMPSAGECEAHVPKIAHRHGLTLGELANLYYAEIGAKYPLHVISALATDSNRQLMPWTIAPASDIPGFFTCDLYSGGGLWNNTNVTPGIGTARPYEYIGAPFVKPLPLSEIPPEESAYLRQCSFTPACGRYAGEKCFGYQIILNPGMEYHSFLHTLRLMRAFRKNFPEFRFEKGFTAKLSDPLLMSFLEGDTDLNTAKEHIKVEEQKWMRKAKKFLLYEDQPYRIK